MVFYRRTVVADRGVDVMAGRHEVGHSTAKAVSHRTDPAIALARPAREIECTRQIRHSGGWVEVSK